MANSDGYLQISAFRSKVPDTATVKVVALNSVMFTMTATSALAMSVMVRTKIPVRWRKRWRDDFMLWIFFAQRFKQGLEVVTGTAKGWIGDGDADGTAVEGGAVGGEREYEEGREERGKWFFFSRDGFLSGGGCDGKE